MPIQAIALLQQTGHSYFLHYRMSNNLSLENKNILITGVSRASGIGAAIAKTCVQAGAKVAIHGNPQYDAEREYPDASSSFQTNFAKKYNLKVLSPSNLANPEEPEKIIASARELLGCLDGLVLNHAYSINADIFNCTAENIDNHFNINVRASMLMIKAFAQQSDRDRGGVITLFTNCKNYLLLLFHANFHYYQTINNSFTYTLLQKFKLYKDSFINQKKSA